MHDAADLFIITVELTFSISPPFFLFGREKKECAAGGGRKKSYVGAREPKPRPHTPRIVLTSCVSLAPTASGRARSLRCSSSSSQTRCAGLCSEQKFQRPCSRKSVKPFLCLNICLSIPFRMRCLRPLVLRLSGLRVPLSTFRCLRGRA